MDREAHKLLEELVVRTYRLGHAAAKVQAMRMLPETLPGLIRQVAAMEPSAEEIAMISAAGLKEVIKQ